MLNELKLMVRDQESLSQIKPYLPTFFVLEQNYPNVPTTLEAGVINVTNCSINITTTCAPPSSNKGNKGPLKHR